jgi:hypothetical protein
LNDKTEMFEIVSKTAYLIGVRKGIFENETIPLELDWYNKLNDNKEARIIRSLCKMRTVLMLYLQKIEAEMVYNLKNLHTLPQYFSLNNINQLKGWGIDIIKANCRPMRYILDINMLIRQRIDACRDLYPLWMKWAYIRDMFIMPGSSKEDDIKKEIQSFTSNLYCYPYQQYINWPNPESGNLLYNDRKFVKALYAVHKDVFVDNSKVLDIGSEKKNDINDFLRRSRGTVMAVDCENADPYKLYSFLRSLKDDELKKISKILLYDDYRTSRAWALLEKFTSITIEREVVERVNNFKSLVDIKMTAGICREHYQNNINSFILVSSDSDFWGLISSITNAAFLVLIEGEKCGSTIKQAFNESGILYCYIDNFCTGNNDGLKSLVFAMELKKYLYSMVNINVDTMFAEICAQCRLELTPGEKKNLYDKYIKHIRMNIDANGNLTLTIPE